MSNIVTFKQFLINERKTAFFTFARMNPPTRGHEKVFEFMNVISHGNPCKIFLSKTHDNNKNPLLFEDKVKISRKIFPKYSRQIDDQANVFNVLDAATSLYEQDFHKIVLVIGEDRLTEFEILLNKYNGKKNKHGFFIFEDIKVLSAGVRDPDSLTVSGVSSSKLRESAKRNNFISFAQGLPRNVDNRQAKELFALVQEGLEVNIDNQVNDKRDKYISGNLFQVDDPVMIAETGELATVKMLGANYVIVENNNGQRLRKWLSDIEKQ